MIESGIEERVDDEMGDSEICSTHESEVHSDRSRR